MGRVMSDEQRERRNARAREWRQQNREHCLDREKRRYERDATTWRSASLMHKYGLTIEQYEGLVIRQSGLCLVCERPETATRNGKVKRLAVDHCHRTGEVRGLLCSRCNQALGLLKECRRRISNLHAYIEERSA